MDVESPSMFNPFECLDIEPQFDLDLADLEQKYFSCQVAAHPDRFAMASAKEKEQAATQSADVNRAYHTLKNPLTRAESLLQLKNISVPGVSGQTIQDPEFLMETLELREQLEDSKTLEQLQQLELKVHTSFKDCCTLFSGKLSEADPLSLQSLYLQMSYLSKTLGEIKIRRHRD